MANRNEQFRNLNGNVYDVLVIGAGINGAASAAALTAAGVQVALVDAADFAGCTSSESSNLIWGGIKYLENLEVGFVRQLCQGRNELMRSYPGSIRETRFLAAVHKKSRFPTWVLWLGTWVYWCLSNGFTGIPRYLSRRGVKSQESIIKTVDLAGGLIYSDARLIDGDSRFVLNLVKQAIRSGATAVNYLEVIELQRESGGNWIVTLTDRVTGGSSSLRARYIVNAGGPFADELNRKAQFDTTTHHVYSKGIHLIVDPITDSGRVLVFYADDGRMFFAIPMSGKTCIGTTDTAVESPLAEVTDEDRQFVLDNINRQLDLTMPLTRDDILAERCGVRLLVATGARDHTRDDWLNRSRQFVAEASSNLGIVCIFGGKLTDCLKVGEEVCRAVSRFGIGCDPGKWYGEPGQELLEEFNAKLREVDAALGKDNDLPWDKLWRKYGADALEILESILRDKSRSKIVLQPEKICRAELEMIRNQEHVESLDDFLRRRTWLAQTHRLEEMADMPGIFEACSILFDGLAAQKYEDYFHTSIAQRAS